MQYNVTFVWRDTMGVITYGGGYLYGVPLITVGWAEYEDYDTDRSLCVFPIYGLNHPDTQRTGKGIEERIYKRKKSCKAVQ